MKVRLKEDPREWRKSTLLTLLPLAVAGGLLRWRHVLPVGPWLGLMVVLAGTAGAACLRPQWFRGYYRFSTRAGFWLSDLLAKLILVAVFLLLLVPLGLLLRLLGQDPLRLKRDPLAASYWSTAKDPGPLDRLF